MYPLPFWLLHALIDRYVLQVSSIVITLFYFTYLQFEAVLNQMKKEQSNIGLVNNEMIKLSTNLSNLQKVCTYTYNKHFITDKPEW